MANKIFRISVVRAMVEPEGVVFKEVRRESLRGGFGVHKNEVQRLQSQFDAACQPQRAYVIDEDDVPVFAGAQLEDEE